MSDTTTRKQDEGEVNAISKGNRPETSYTISTPVVEETNDMTATQGSATDVGIHHTPKANNAQPLE